MEVEHWMDCNVAIQAVQSNSECHVRYSGSQQAGAKLRRARGKQPRSPIKVPKSILSGKGCGIAQTARMLA